MTLIVVLAASSGASAAQLRNRNFPHGLSNRKSFATTLPLSRKTSANLPKLLVTAQIQDVWAALVDVRLAAVVAASNMTSASPQQIRIPQRYASVTLLHLIPACAGMTYVRRFFSNCANN
jgi:hypothetical protein